MNLHLTHNHEHNRNLFEKYLNKFSELFDYLCVYHEAIISFYYSTIPKFNKSPTLYEYNFVVGS